jgi:hypothetical protein
VRPHDLVLDDAAAGGLRGRIELVEALGPNLLVHAKSEHGVSFRVMAPVDAPARHGDHISARLTAERVHVFSDVTGERLPAA